MSTPDEMGLTPDAALGYEQFFVPAIFHQWPARIISAAEIVDSDDVLDVGCGTGASTRELAKVVAENGSVTGFDFSESMLGVARNVCPGVTFHQGNVTDLPFGDSTFDVVVSSFMLMFVPNPQQALSEMRRVLRPGGRVAVAVWQALDNNPVYRALVEATREVVGDESATSMAWPFIMGEAGPLTSLFESGGLSHVSITAHDGDAKFPSVEDLVRIEIQGWLLADTVNEHQIEEIAAKLRARYPGFSGVSGPINFPMNALIARARAG